MKKIIALSLCIVTFLLAICFNVGAENEARVFDLDLLLDGNEINRINKAALEAEAEIGAKIFIVTHEADGRSDKYIGENFLEDHSYGFNDDIILLVITRNLNYGGFDDEYYYNLYLYGKADSRIGSIDVDTILDDDDVYYNIKDGELCDGILAFIECSVDAYKIPWVLISVIAVIVGAIVCAIAVGSVTAKYRMKLRPTNYPLNKYANMSLTDSSDEFAGKHVATVIVSSGGGRGGSRGGGGFGGGRGHAGGR